MKGKIIPTSDTKTSWFDGDKNTFGLLPGPKSKGGTCLCATTEAGGCMETRKGRTLPTCYVYHIAAFRPNVLNSLAANTELLTSCSGSERVDIFASEFQRYVESWSRYVSRNTDTVHSLPAYRIHWSGDCPDIGYVADLRIAMEFFPGMRFWGYSRAQFTIPVMRGLKNCMWYLSVDDVTMEPSREFIRLIARDTQVSLAYMGKEKHEGFEQCGSDTVGHKGACKQCQKCLRGEPVWFPRR